jgi:hypothetical protein
MNIQEKLSIDEMKKKLGFRIEDRKKDPQNLDYLIPRKAVSPSVRMKFYPTGPILDQGSTPQCVAYSTVQLLRTGPVSNKFTDDPSVLYHKCQLVDEWDGEDYDGTSVHAAMKVLKSEGYVSEYRWAYDIGTAINHLLTTGPVLVGTNWYSDMFYPDVKTGFLKVSGFVAGGHAWLWKGVNLDYPCPDGSKGAIRMVQSWGNNWGNGPVRGLAWLSISDAARLIAEDGEVATVTEVLKV